MPAAAKRAVVPKATPAKRARTTGCRSTVTAGPIPLRGSAIMRPGVVSMGRQPFPKMLACTLKYNTVIGGTVTAGICDHIFSANGLFQPNLVAADHQPMYFDQLMAVYREYNVLRSRIRMRYLGGNAGLNVQSTIVVNDSSALLTDMDAATESTRSSGIVINSATDNKFVPNINSYSQTQTFGYTALKDLNNGLSGTSTTNPGTAQVYHVMTAAAGGGTISSTQLMMVEIEYDAIFFNVVTIANS